MTDPQSRPGSRSDARPGMEPDLAGEMSRLGPDGAAVLLADLVAEEDSAVLANRLRPYQDQVPKVLRALPTGFAAAMLERMPASAATRALFRNFSRIPDEHLQTLLGAIDPPRAASLIDAMAVGLDGPREMARVLTSGRPVGLAPAMGHSHPATVVRLLFELDPPGQAAFMEIAGPKQAEAVGLLLRAAGNRVHESWAGWLAEAAARGGSPATVADGPRPDDPPGGLRAALDQASVRVAPSTLAYLHPSTALRAIRLMGAERAAQLLSELANRDATLAADLLEVANRSILLRPPRRGIPPAWWVHECPAVAVIAALDLGAPESVALVRAMRPAQREIVLDRAPAAVRERLAAVLDTAASGGLHFSLDVMGVARGRRRSRTVDSGLRWVHIEEVLDTGRTAKPVVIDLLELPLETVRLEARMAVGEQVALPVERAAEVFEQFRRTGTRPGAGTFARLGLTQLSRAVAPTDATAAINGSFYFDYGHYVNGVTLGIDVARVPGLFLGDPIGWYVQGGREVIPPAVNRAAGIVTDDCRLHIERVFMTDVSFPDGTRLTWDALNIAKEPEVTIAYTSLYGFRTEASPSHVDVAVARGKVWSIARQGDQIIPLTGFVLSVPVAEADRILARVGPGDDVSVGNNFPADRGRVVEAMACGPSLVRDGTLDVDFTDEDFGQQDSTVMSFCLPRTMETYDAARSFMAVRGPTLILGTVSGTAYGYGGPELSAGMTFGELAQLCIDLGVDDAYALDGGGSSSLVARIDGEVRVLNSPTGGADMGQGQERFINTYWLALGR